MIVEVVTPSAVVWRGNSQSVRFPSQDGEMGILPGHAPVVALVSEGNVSIATDEGEKVWKVSGGFATVDSDRVSVLVDEASEASR